MKSGAKSKTHWAALLVLAVVGIGCNIGSTENVPSNVSNSAKGPKPDAICQLLARPQFESRFEYDGKSCSGSTTFGVKDTRTASYETDLRASFSYLVMGETGTVQRISLNMSKRPDGGEFFAGVSDSVSKAISGQPLSEKMRQAITGALLTSGGNFTTTDQIGTTKVELVRSATDSVYSMTFNF